MKLMVMIDGPMISKFIEDSAEFDKYASEKFKMINQLQEKVAESMAMDGEESRDDRFIAVDLEKYKVELKEMMKAVAEGIGNTPLNVLVDEGSMLLKIHEFENARIIKEKEEFKEKMKIEQEERERRIVESPKKVVIEGSRKIKKKNSFDLLNFCGCSGKQFVKNN